MYNKKLVWAYSRKEPSGWEGPRDWTHKRGRYKGKTVTIQRAWNVVPVYFRYSNGYSGKDYNPFKMFTISPYEADRPGLLLSLFDSHRMTFLCEECHYYEISHSTDPCPNILEDQNGRKYVCASENIFRKRDSRLSDEIEAEIETSPWEKESWDSYVFELYWTMGGSGMMRKRCRYVSHKRDYPKPATRAPPFSAEELRRLDSVKRAILRRVDSGDLPNYRAITRPMWVEACVHFTGGKITETRARSLWSHIDVWFGFAFRKPGNE